MGSPDETVRRIASADTWEQRIAQIRLIPQQHGTGEHSAIYAALARRLYIPHLTPDFAYIHRSEFYELEVMEAALARVLTATDGFSRVSVRDLATLIESDPKALLVFRTIIGLTKEEFGHATELLPAELNLPCLSGGKVNSMEQEASKTSASQARTAAETIDRIMSRELFDAPPGDLRSKQDKPDTASGWASVVECARKGVPYSVLLHQRHYGGAFRQILDATSSKRGDIIEDAVEALFEEHEIPYVRTGSHNQGEIAKRFGVQVAPAPDFVVFDSNDTLRAILECKGASDGGTARDKALRFTRLRAESNRLGGVPLLAVLGGMGWERANDTMGPVIRDTDGRVFTLGTLEQMMEVAPFPELQGI